MTKQEFETVKTIIYACSHPVWSNGMRVPYADTDRIIASLEKIFAQDFGIARETPLQQIWKEEDDLIRASKEQDGVDNQKDCDSAANFLMKIINRSRKNDTGKK